MSTFIVSLISLAAGSVGTWLATSSLKVFQPVLVEFLQRKSIEYIARMRLPVFTKRRLGGDWHHVWYAKGSRNWKDQNRCRVTLYSLGPHAAGIWEDSGSRWFVTAKLGGDNLVMGEWKELKTNGYRGSWMGRLSLKGQSIGGLYLGNSDREPQFGVGEWIWWRVGTAMPVLPVPHVQMAMRDMPISPHAESAPSEADQDN